jgi:hypothetical protein
MQGEKMATGSFYKPEVVLDNVARSSPTEQGVIVISTRDLTGRIGVTNNSIINGGVVDSTGETGTAAVCKLLLLSYANYTFRRAIPMDQFHLDQDLNLSFDDVKKFLNGPSQIGLACPADQVLRNLRPSQNAGKATSVPTGMFDWETTGFRTTYDEAADPNSDPDAYEVAPQREIYESYVHDCNLILEAIKEKRQEEIDVIHVLSQPRKTQTEIDLAKPGPLPSRKAKVTIKIEPMWVVAGACLVLGLGGFSMLSHAHSSGNLSLGTNGVDDPYALETAQIASTPTPPPEKPGQPKPAAAGTAPFALPSSTSNPPPNPTPAAETDDSSSDAPPIVEEPPAPMRGASTLAPAPAASAAGNEEVNRWVEAVRKKPGDVSARRSLAYSYLVAGNSPSAIEQFYAVMKMERVDSTEIIEFADNMTAFCGRNNAKQFLTDILRADPGQTAVRQKLSTL